MRKDFKSLFLVEITLLFVTGLFLIDFLPRNYKEFQSICLNMWANDAKQFQMCMDPYYKQMNTDKLALGAIVLSLILFPIFFLKRKRGSTKN